MRPSSVRGWAQINLAGDDHSKSMLSAFEGLFWRNPVQAGALTVAMLSFAGIPLTAGFIGRFYLITLSIQSQLWVMLTAMVLGSVIAIYYYLRIIFAMSKTPGTMIKAQSTAAFGAEEMVASLLLLLVLALGRWPQPFIEFAGAL